MLQYLRKESQNKSILGPFKDNPFSSGIKISLLNAVPKKDSSERRVILDLSCPKGASVNDFIRKEFYLNKKKLIWYTQKLMILLNLFNRKVKAAFCFRLIYAEHIVSWAIVPRHII